MSGWAVYRQQPSAAVWGGVAAVSNVPVFAAVSSSGWAVYRFQPSTAVWGGIAAISNIAPSAAGITPGGFQDRRPGYLKKRILFGA